MAPDAQAKQRDFQVRLLSDLAFDVPKCKPFYLQRETFKSILAEVRLGAVV